MNADEVVAVVATSDDSPKRTIDNASHLDEIEPGLWIGNASAATDVEGLRRNHITHVLTLDSCPLPAHVLQQPDIVNKYIQVSDVAKEDLLTHFDECIRFIDDAFVQHKNVLVHWVKAKRANASPNSGFVQQLRLWNKMGWKIDPQHELFKLYRLRLAGDKVRKAKILPQTCLDLVKPDPALVQANPEPNVYRCRKCRRVVAAKSNIMSHITTTNTASVPPAAIVATGGGSALATDLAAISLSVSDHSSSSDIAEPAPPAKQPQRSPPLCSDIIFVEPIAWMEGVLREPQGKLNCPKCQTKLGSFSWTMGCHCPCGVQVSPAFYLVAGRVELSRSVQNVEVSV